MSKDGESRTRQASEALGVLGDGLYRASALLRLLDDLPPNVRKEVVTLTRQRFNAVVDQIAATQSMLDQL